MLEKSRVVDAVLIAFAYAGAGYAGNLLAIQSGFASAVWPAAGIALALTLSRGAVAIVGTFFGAVAINAWITYESAGLGPLGEFAAFVSAVALGAALQAGLGAWLIRRFLGARNPLLEGGDIVKFQLLAVASCFFNATVGTTSLVGVGILPSIDYALNWMTWWVGDAIGCLIFAPLTLVLLEREKHRTTGRKLTVVLPQVLTFVLVLVFFNFASILEKHRRDNEFEKQASAFAHTVQSRLDGYLATLSFLKSLFDASAAVDRAEFRRFTATALEKMPGIKAFFWNRVVASEDRAAFESEMRREMENFVISENGVAGEARPAAARSQHVVVTYVEPLAGNEHVLGYDSASNRARRDALEKARQSGKAAATPPLELLQGRYGSGILIFDAVYAPGSTGYHAERPIFGYAAAAFLIPEVLQNASESLTQAKLGVAVYDVTSPERQRLIYRTSELFGAGGDGVDLRFEGSRYSTIVRLADRQWRLEIFPDAAYMRSWGPWFVLVGGFVFTGLLGVLLLVLTGRTSHVEQLVVRRTSELAAANAELEREIQERKRLESKKKSRNKVLESLASGASLDRILEQIAVGTEGLNPEMCCAVSLLDHSGRRLRVVAAPNLPHRFNETIDGLLIDDGAGICGTAAFTGKRVIVEDIRSHPFWRENASAALEAGLQACWAEPIFSSKGQVLGTFAAYYPRPHRPSAEELELARGMAHLAGIAIERKRAEDELRIAATTFQSHEGIMITDAQGAIVRVNRAFTEITGYAEAEVIDRTPRIFSSGRHDAEFYRRMYAALKTTGQWQSEIWNRRKSGDIFPVWETITAVRNDAGEITHFVVMLSDITEHKENELRIRHLAYYDPLTALPNRLLLLDRLEQVLAAAVRHGLYGALLFLDLDRFKTLNDSLGHQMGDRFLQEAGKRLRDALREEDTAARLGGDEFVILMPGQQKSSEKAADAALHLAEKIRQTVAEPFRLAGHEFALTASIGIALFPGGSNEANELLKQADTAMYRSKAVGRNVVCFYEPSMQAVADQRFALENDIRHALKENALTLSFQPQHHLYGELIGAEVLLRWHHPERGWVSPEDIVDIAEESGLIVEIGRWVLKAACDQLKRWRDDGYELSHLSVNVSPRQFHRRDFVEEVAAIVQAAGVPPRCLILELTEGLLIADLEDVVKKMNALKAMGIGVAIDDFGTGYSSLAYLKSLPIDHLKIDKSFVRGMECDPKNPIIVEMIIDIAYDMGISVIAEGVETEYEIVFLRSKNCAAFQGNYFSPPLDAAEFGRYMERHGLDDQGEKLLPLPFRNRSSAS